MSVEIKMLKPRNDVEYSLSSSSEAIVYSMPTKVVKFDSYEACYSNKSIALRDALLFCSINDL
ncbi:hypothetical protein [Histophilus somni]|uniref:hypothetical protein n=1 Tax=Histophilus somni TaxID=731 RepID=UPI00201E7C79|nr:hypothetical protein [Histophilus somni]